MSSYVVHSDEDIFPNPVEFLPSRRFGEKGKALQPYSIPL